MNLYNLQVKLFHQVNLDSSTFLQVSTKNLSIQKIKIEQIFQIFIQIDKNYINHQTQA